MPPSPILSASVPRYKRHCCSFNSFRRISDCCCVVIPRLSLIPLRIWKLFADEPLAGAACSCFLREESKDTGTPPIQDRHSQVKQALIPFRTCFHPQTRQVLMGFGGRHSQKHL